MNNNTKSADFIALDAGFGNTRLYGPKGSIVLQSLVATLGGMVVAWTNDGQLRTLAMVMTAAVVLGWLIYLCTRRLQRVTTS